MFGTMKVISNVVHMVSCRRTKHSIVRQVLMFFYMVYYIVIFLFSYLTVGAMYTSITLFLSQTFGKLLEAEG